MCSSPFKEYRLPPEAYTGDITGAEIAVAPSGKFAYVSNRGHDSVGIFAINEASGTLTAIGWEPVRGRKPRFFCLDPRGTRLFAANENSHTIVVFSIDADTGMLAPTGQIIETGSPSCIVFATQ